MSKEKKLTKDFVPGEKLAEHEEEIILIQEQSVVIDLAEKDSSEEEVVTTDSSQQEVYEKQINYITSTLDGFEESRKPRLIEACRKELEISDQDNNKFLADETVTQATAWFLCDRGDVLVIAPRSGTTMLGNSDEKADQLISDVCDIIDNFDLSDKRFLVFGYRMGAHFMSVVINTKEREVRFTNSTDGDYGFGKETDERVTRIKSVLERKFGGEFKYLKTPNDNRVQQDDGYMCGVHTIINNLIFVGEPLNHCLNEEVEINDLDAIKAAISNKDEIRLRMIAAGKVWADVAENYGEKEASQTFKLNKEADQQPARKLASYISNDDFLGLLSPEKKEIVNRVVKKIQTSQTALFSSQLNCTPNIDLVGSEQEKKGKIEADFQANFTTDEVGIFIIIQKLFDELKDEIEDPEKGFNDLAPKLAAKINEGTELNDFLTKEPSASSRNSDYNSRTTKPRSFALDADDSSDEEGVTNKIYGTFDEATKKRGGGYDLNEAWNKFLKDKINEKRSKDSLENLAKEYFLHNEPLDVPTEDSEIVTLKSDNIDQYLKLEGWRKFMRNVIDGDDVWLEEMLTEKYRDSFITHAFGIGLLYSEQVENLYHGEEKLKSQYFFDPAFTNNLSNLIERAAKYAVRKSAEEHFDGLYRKKSESKEQQEQIELERQTFIDEVVDEIFGVKEGSQKRAIDEFIGKSHEELNNILFNKDINLKTAIMESVRVGINGGIGATPEEGFVSHLKLAIDFVVTRNSMETVSLDQKEKILVPDNEILKSFFQELKDLGVVQKASNSDKKKYPNHTGWKLASGKRKSNIPDSEGFPLSIKYFKSLFKNDSVTNVVLSESEIEELLKKIKKDNESYLEKFNQDDSYRTPARMERVASNSFLRSSSLRPVGEEMIDKVFEKNLSKYLDRSMISRKELPRLHSFEKSENDGFEQDFAAERVVMRGLKRAIRERKYRPIGNTKYPIRTIELAYKFNPSEDWVKERSNIDLAAGSSDPSLTEYTDTTKTAGHSDYVNIFSTLSKYSKEYSLNSKRIVGLIRNGLDQELDDSLIEFDPVEANNLKLFLSGFRRLFVGMESRRNPSQRILSQMMLDILEDKPIEDWGSYLAGTEANNHVDKKMPMMRVKVLPVARQKNSLMSDYMPWIYVYPGTEEDSKEKTKETPPDLEELLKKESEILNEWLDLKQISKGFTEEALLVNCDKWYGIEMAPVVYGADQKTGQLKNPADIAAEKLATIGDELLDGDYELLAKLAKKYYGQQIEKFIDKCRECFLEKKEEEKLLSVIAKISKQEISNTLPGHDESNDEFVEPNPSPRSATANPTSLRSESPLSPSSNRIR